MLHYDESNWPISVSMDIPVSAEKVWNQMTTPGNAVLWHPFVKEHISESWNGIGSRDKVIYNSGANYEREVVRWVDGTGFDMKVTQNGKNEILVIWRVARLDDNNCNLKFSAHVTFIEKLPFPIRWALHKFKIKPLFSTYLKLSMQGFSFHASTGERVKRNQFGPHSLFSP